MERIILRYGLVNIIDSYRGPHFTSSVLQQVIRALGIKWELHTPWHPQRSGTVERVNQTLENILTKLVLETQWNWVKCLPLENETQNRSRGLSLRNVVWAAFLAYPIHIGEHLEAGTTMQKYIETVTTTIEELRKKGYLPQAFSRNCKIHGLPCLENPIGGTTCLPGTLNGGRNWPFLWCVCTSKCNITTMCNSMSSLDSNQHWPKQHRATR